MTEVSPVVKRTSRLTVRSSPIVHCSNDKYSKRSKLKLLWRLVLALLVIACLWVALANRQRAALDLQAHDYDHHCLCKEDHPQSPESQELWTEMRDRFRLLPTKTNDVAVPTATFWKGPRPTAPWTHRCATSRYRASQTVASMLEAQRKMTSEDSGGLALDNERDPVKPENVTQLQQVLGNCGLEFMELMTTCAPNQNNPPTQADTTIAIFTLVYAVEQLDLIPEEARADPRYRILDQTRNAALPDPRHDGVAQFPQLFPLRHVFQAQISELGALLAIDDALTRQVPRQGHETVASSSSSSSSLSMPTWVGINPVKRFLPRHVLDGLQLDPTGRDDTTIFFWTTCCAGHDLRTQLQEHHQFESGPDLDQLHLDIARSVFGSSYTTELPAHTWSYKGTFLMHHTLFLEFACFCKVFLSHLLDRYVTVLRRSSSRDAEHHDILDVESIRPELFLNPEVGNGHTNTLERSWGYFFERLINYWAYNAGYGLVMIHNTEPGKTREIQQHRGRWTQLQPTTESSNLTQSQKRLRSCRSMFCSKSMPRLFSTVVEQQQAQCPHLYDDREIML